MDKLLFDENASETNNNFHAGLNVTVRNGTKYIETLKIGQFVRLENLKGEFLGAARVHQMMMSALVSLPPAILEMEHDPKCREVRGLFEVMKACYPDIKITDIVTAVVLDVDPRYDI